MMADKILKAVGKELATERMKVSTRDDFCIDLNFQNIFTLLPVYCYNLCQKSLEHQLINA